MSAIVRGESPDSVVYEHDGVTVHNGDCLDVLATLPPESVHAVITDPPYELGFMGKKWDATGIAFRPDVWRECLRVLRPGGHLLAFGGTRTAHRLTCAIEDAGFDIRDTITWLYGTGFPKSHDVSKAIDKAAGAQRETVGEGSRFGRGSMRNRSRVEAGYRPTEVNPDGGTSVVTVPATADAQAWQGWGTALKPAHEPIIVARKPLSGTVAANVLEHGTGGLNIDGCRVGTGEGKTPAPLSRKTSRPWFTTSSSTNLGGNDTVGRWPPNVVLAHADECGGDCAGWSCSPGCPVVDLDAQSGQMRAGGGHPRARGMTANAVYGVYAGQSDLTPRPVDGGGASRFFPVFRWQAKAPASERPRVDGVAHPTVKPVALLRWLTRLVTPPGGLVLDPFLGSGTTAQAARDEGFQCIGIEREAAYVPLIRGRLTPGG